VKIDFDQIRELLAVVSQTDITEFTIESGDEKITVKKEHVLKASGPVIELPAARLHEMPVQAAQEKPAESPAATIPQPAPEESSSANALVPIASPMVGTFYTAASPSAPAFVEVGDVVKVGQTVCIIEAMKLMNDLPAEVSGKIVEVCVENGTTVEFGQALFMVDPRG
jgi:acetyl-CoA carboxylase biotin carboxyl carrier protein